MLDDMVKALKAVHEMNKYSTKLLIAQGRWVKDLCIILTLSKRMFKSLWWKLYCISFVNGCVPFHITVDEILLVVQKGNNSIHHYLVDLVNSFAFQHIISTTLGCHNNRWRWTWTYLFVSYLFICRPESMIWFCWLARVGTMISMAITYPNMESKLFCYLKKVITTLSFIFWQ